jgi:2-polyprenyl-6-methoxyphenol hydroxylase-like FAD-dependent oxidoreductase
MSPIGGVGINLAIQDAVAAANILAPRLRQGAPSDDDLRAVQRRREFPTRATQQLQLFIQNRVIGRVLESTGQLSPPLALRLLDQWALLRRVPARLIGLGFRPEHVASLGRGLMAAALQPVHDLRNTNLHRLECAGRRSGRVARSAGAPV